MWLSTFSTQLTSGRTLLYQTPNTLAADHIPTSTKIGSRDQAGGILCHRRFAGARDECGKKREGAESRVCTDLGGCVPARVVPPLCTVHYRNTRELTLTIQDSCAHRNHISDATSKLAAPGAHRSLLEKQRQHNTSSPLLSVVYPMRLEAARHHSASSSRGQSFVVSPGTRRYPTSPPGVSESSCRRSCF